MMKHAHKWVQIRKGYPQSLCKCGMLKVGTHTVLLGDLVRYTSTKAPAAVGEVGMNLATGRVQQFVGGVVQNVANLTDITAGGVSYASLVKTDGNLVLGVTGLGVFVDLPGLNSVSFTPTAPGTALVHISGTGGVNVLTNQGLALNVNAVDLYPASIAVGPFWYGGDPGTPGMNGFSTDGTGGGGMAHTISMAVPIAVLAALTTVKIRVSVATGFLGPGFVAANASCPLFLTVIYQ